MAQPIVFVSHAAADSDLATAFKEDAETNFLGMCRLFVSSNLDSIAGGSEWIREIKANLEQASILVCLLSPIAIQRPWIYVEFGAGWIRSIPTIAVCHSGLSREQLPVPLLNFQALNLSDEVHLRHLYEQVTAAVGCKLPPANFAGLVARYRDITEVHRRARALRDWYSRLVSWNPELSRLANEDAAEVLVPAEADAAFRQVLPMFASENFLAFEPRGMAMGTRVGFQATVWIARKGTAYAAQLTALSTVK